MVYIIAMSKCLIVHLSYGLKYSLLDYIIIKGRFYANQVVGVKCPLYVYLSYIRGGGKTLLIMPSIN